MSRLEFALGDLIFKKYFDINEKSYKNRYEDDKTDARLDLEFWSKKDTNREKEKEDILRMLQHYCEALALVADIHNVRHYAFFHKLFLEFQRRILVAEDKDFITEIRKNISNVWGRYNNLKRKKDILYIIELTLDIKYIALNIKGRV
jgi:hypothetical protein